MSLTFRAALSPLQTHPKEHLITEWCFLIQSSWQWRLITTVILWNTPTFKKVANSQTGLLQASKYSYDCCPYCPFICDPSVPLFSLFILGQSTCCTLGISQLPTHIYLPLVYILLPTPLKASYVNHSSFQKSHISFSVFRSHSYSPILSIFNDPDKWTHHCSSQYA